MTECINEYKKQEQCCITITLLANILWKDRSVLCLYHGHSLVDEKIDFLLNFHRSQTTSNKDYNLRLMLDILKELILLPELPQVIDIGILINGFEHSQSINKESLIAKLWYIQLNNNLESRDVVLYGFGRIGRLLARELCSDPALKIHLKLRAVVTRDPVSYEYLQKRASLLSKDSVHGRFPGRIDIDRESNSLIVNGISVRFISAESSNEINYMDYDIREAILIDNTGKNRSKESLKSHLCCAGISKVIVTAPVKDIPNVVFGVNHINSLLKDIDVYSTASCTTNALCPVLNTIEANFGILKGHVETIHAYTNDQNLVDNMHAKSRRGRAAALNMVITETGAGAAVAKIIPQLTDKLTSNAIRVPIANGSLAILILELKKKTTVDEVHKLLLNYASIPTKHKQISLSFDQELVSSDIVGNPSAGIVDGCASSVSSDGRTLTLYVWYDNEYGYSMQVLGFANWMATNVSVQYPATTQDDHKSLLSEKSF